MKLFVIIRADASQFIGSGHVMRCLTLARRLKARGAEVIFVCRDFPGNLAEYIKNQGFVVHLLFRNKASEYDLPRPEQPWEESMSKLDAEQMKYLLNRLGRPIDWLIVDHYKIDHRWQAPLRDQVRNIMVIDDLANRRHDCDILLDQNYYHNFSGRYNGLVPQACKLFLGPRYLMLREEFYTMKRRMRVRTSEVANILIFYGGSDPTNETEKCLKVLSTNFSSDFEINVVTGDSNLNKHRIKDICLSQKNVNYNCQVSNIAELMNKADLAFGAGGSTMWERCFLGLPAIVTVTAENQMETTQAVSDLGVIWNLGSHEGVNGETILKAVERILMESNLLADMQKKSLDIVGGSSCGLDKLIDVIFQSVILGAK